MDCVIYIRWSSAEQSRGSSLERQLGDCRKHAADNGWQIIEELIDDGVSAFKGQHADTGSLGSFVRRVESGEYPDGVTLLCEKLDRLSRQEPGRVFIWMMQLTEAGVTVATVEGSRRYPKGGFDMAAIIEVVVKAQVSHEESEKKSQRLAAAWASKRKRLEGGEKFVMSRRAPAWLTVEGQPPIFRADPERAVIVRRIYEETAAGYGKHHIARNLNRDGIPTFGRATAWHASYIQKILRGGAVLGEFQPGRKQRGGKRQNAGAVILGYYPAVVDADLYQRAHASMKDRSRRATGRGRRLVNLLSGLAHCAECGAKMTFRGKGRKQRADGSWVDEDYLVCDAYQRGIGCGNGMHFNYRLWEGGVLDPVLYEALRGDAFAPQGEIRELEIILASAQREKSNIHARAASALELAIETGRHEAKAAWLDLSERADALEPSIADLRERLIRLRGRTTPEEHRDRIAELRASLDDDDEDIRFEARAKVMAAINNLVDDIRFSGGEQIGVRMRFGKFEAYIHYNSMTGGTDWTLGRIDGEPFATLHDDE